jgi:tetratricopeptide (TPR) repeat protein
VKFLSILFLFSFAIPFFGQKAPADKNAIEFANVAEEKWSFYVRENRDSLYIIGKNLLEIGSSNRNKCIENIGKVYIASYLIRTGKTSLGRKIYQPLLTRYSEKKDLVRECRILTEIGNSFFLEGLVDESLFYFEKSLGKASESNDAKVREQSRISYAKVLLKQKKYVDAEKQLKLHCENLKNTTFYVSISNAWSVLSTLYIETKQDSLSNLALCESLKYAKRSNSKSALANAYNNLAIQAVQQNQIKDAFKMFELAEGFYNEIRNNIGIIQIYYNFGLLYHMEKNYLKAIESFNISRKFSTEIDNIPSEIEALYELNLIAKDRNNNALAFSILDTIVARKDDQIKKVKAQISEEHDYAQNIISLDKFENSRKNELAQRNNFSEKYLIWFIIIFIGVSFVTFALIKNRRALKA